MALVELLGAKVQGKDGEVDVASISSENDVVGLYFSAHWCPPCRAFTPQLAEYYTKLRSNGKKFEIVFVSSDRDQSNFDGYYAEMPWKALPFSDRDRKDNLGSKYSVSGIPTLILLNAKSGETITNNGRGKVREDPEGEFCKA